MGSGQYVSNNMGWVGEGLPPGRRGEGSESSARASNAIYTLVSFNAICPVGAKLRRRDFAVHSAHTAAFPVVNI